MCFMCHMIILFVVFMCHVILMFAVFMCHVILLFAVFIWHVILWFVVFYVSCDTIVCNIICINIKYCVFLVLCVM